MNTNRCVSYIKQWIERCRAEEPTPAVAQRAVVAGGKRAKPVIFTGPCGLPGSREGKGRPAMAWAPLRRARRFLAAGASWGWAARVVPAPCGGGQRREPEPALRAGGRPDVIRIKLIGTAGVRQPRIFLISVTISVRRRLAAVPKNRIESGFSVQITKKPYAKLTLGSQGRRDGP